MKNLFIILIALSLGSCATQKRCNEKYPTVTKDSIVYKEVIKDTTIYIENKSVEYRDTLFCDSLGIIKDFKKTFQSNGVKGTFEVKHNKVTIICETDSLKAQINYLQKIISTKKQDTIVECKKEHRTKLDTFCRYFTIIVLLILGARLAIKLYLKQIP